ncbi:winged helix DNA-binding domain-containing protein [Halobium salinum]|uniref:Winged helix DNA-binding domain-containing protein n=1 Tax=Halobium salinum TaxID=1364940 RepID=A0ABD5PCX4_9EURY|nr:winged helix DNA-binding domain-containing protein [Halobium salinum]
MTLELSVAAARRLRLRAQGLDRRPDDRVSIADAVAGACGLQAQEKTAAALSVRARCPGTTLADVDDALATDRSVVRTWGPRGTLHLLPTADLPWLLSLFGPTFATRSPEPKRLAELGLDDEAVADAVVVIREAIAADGPLTRDDLAARLETAGVEVPPRSQLVFYLVRRAALWGVICEVGPLGGASAYDLLDESVEADAGRAEGPDREAALTELARRYLAAYGPTSLPDFAAWSGLYAADVRAAWAAVEDERVEVLVEGASAPAAMLAEDVSEIGPVSDTVDAPSDGPAVRLLPGYDTYLLGYAPENRPVPAEHTSTVWPGGGVIRPTVVVDGAVVGTWTLDRTRRTVGVAVEPFEPSEFGSVVAEGVHAEATDVGRFLGAAVDARIAGVDAG